MNLFQAANKKLTIALLIAATGIPVSAANAQFKVEYSAKADNSSQANQQSDHTVTIVKSNDDEHTYEVKIVNGKVEIAKIDGDQVDDDQLKVKEGMVIFISEDGKTVHELKVPNVSTKGTQKSIWVTSSDGQTDHKSNHNVFFDQKDGQKLAWTSEAHPKVMLGINLGEPSKILRKHLKIGDDMKVILVENVIKGLPAELGGLEDFDVIVSLDGSDEASGEMLSKILSEKEAGDLMKVVVLRSGEKIKLKVHLAAYDGEALGAEDKKQGSITYFDDATDKRGHGNDQRLKNIFKSIEDSQTGNIQGEELEHLRLLVETQLDKAGLELDLVTELQDKAKAAMQHAQRQMVEFRDGKLVVRATDGAHDRLPGFVSANRFPAINADAMHEHMGGMSERLEALEARMDRQIAQMSAHMEKLTAMFERMMESFEDRD